MIKCHINGCRTGHLLETDIQFGTKLLPIKITDQSRVCSKERYRYHGNILHRMVQFLRDHQTGYQASVKTDIFPRPFPRIFQES